MRLSPNLRHLVLTLSVIGTAIGTAKGGVLETPFTPFKDGYADPSSWIGNSRTLVVRAGATKAWISHALADGAGDGLVKARLAIYVKDVVRDGNLKVSLATGLNYLESQTRFDYLKAKPDTIASVAIGAAANAETIISIPLGEAFLKSVREGSFAGLVLEGTGGLDAEIGALEGSHGAILYLGYTSSTGTGTAPVESVAAALAAKYADQLRGSTGSKGDAGSTGLKGDKGDKGDTGPAGVKGDQGTSGIPGDQSLVFNLLQDRGYRAYYPFDKLFKDSTLDLSGNGNTLKFSDNVLKVKVADGDSALQLVGTGYAVAKNTLSLNPYREITLSAKVSLSTEVPALDTQIVIRKPNQYELAVIKNKLKMRIHAVGSDTAWIGDGDVPSGAWATIQATYDGKSLRGFVNGKLTFFQPYSYGPLALDSTDLYVGGPVAGSNGLKGMLDQVKVLSYAIASPDSLALVPGRATMLQLSADSVTGLATRLGAKANLAGAAFTGNVSVTGAGPAGTGALEVVSNGMVLRGNPGGGPSPQIKLMKVGTTDFFGSLMADDNTSTVRLLNSSDQGVTVTSAGKVGIGTYAPAEMLEVAGKIKATNMLDVASLHAWLANAADFAAPVVNASQINLKYTTIKQNSDATVFAPQADGSITILKAGVVNMHAGYDVVSRSTGAVYATIVAYVNTSAIANSLVHSINATTPYWQECEVSAVWKVSAGDAIVFKAIPDPIGLIDNGIWSTMSLTWTGVP